MDNADDVDKYKGYKLNDLSESLKDALGKNEENRLNESSYWQEFISMIANIEWNEYMPSLRTSLLILYFVLLSAILLGVSKFMWNKYGIKTKSQSQRQPLENQLLGTGKYAQFVNAAIAYKIYKEEMEKMDDSSNDEPDDGSDSDNDNDDENERKINESALLGGYQKSKRVRARTVRKQQMREQKEAYERYRKRLKEEKEIKRYNKMKEKKENKKMMKRMKKQKKNDDNDQCILQ